MSISQNTTSVDVNVKMEGNVIKTNVLRAHLQGEHVCYGRQQFVGRPQRSARAIGLERLEPHVQRPIIFDFDGVIADSETVSNRALAQCLTGHGFPTTPDQSVARYTGMRMADCVVVIENIHGKKLPDGFVEAYRAFSFELLRKELTAVRGAVPFIRSLHRRPIAIASSSGPARLKLSLELIGLTDCFDGTVFSAADLERGKPHPDIYLHAAKNIDVAPRDCIVIEDGTLGIKAAVAAGMTPIGLTAGSHCGPGHAAHLDAAGAAVIAATYQEVAQIVRRLDAQRP